MLKEFTLLTENRHQLVDITNKVEKIVKESKIKDGLVLIFTPHSTAGILLTENESGLKQDFLKIFEKIVSGLDFLHNRIDDNADSHILSGLVGQGKTLPIENGRIIRGTWQQIFLTEFDGPRTRKIIVKVIK
ncbi:YjbQ family protein [bacterium]|nr:YjbQ family protein [bacterium]